MRHINETFQNPPIANEQFHDVEGVVVEFKIFEETDEANGLTACDCCYYNVGDDDLCDGGRCVRIEYADMSPIFGYYVKVGKD